MAGGRRRPCVAAAPLWRGGGGLAGLRSFTERLERYWGTRFGPWVSVRAAPRRAAKGRRPWLAAVDALGAGEIELWLKREERKRGSRTLLSSGLETA